MLFNGRFNNSSTWNRQIEKTIVATTEAHVLGDSVSHLNNNVLVITSSDRTDIILASLLLYQSGTHDIIGLVLSGKPPSQTVMDFINKTGLPVFITEQDVYALALSVHNLAVKITSGDKIKIDVLTNLFLKYGVLEPFHEAIFGASEMKIYWKDKVKLQLSKLKSIFTSKKQ
jgi:BioD-like phosphotransacetylase family protein